MRIAIIGSGLAGLSAAALLAGDGHDLEVLERAQNRAPSGRDCCCNLQEQISLDASVRSRRLLRPQPASPVCAAPRPLVARC
jgi:2-polyprenyl-6-methoxyphenol hydroxylase-like FAD-dependent oxidoreductase